MTKLEEFGFRRIFAKYMSRLTLPLYSDGEILVVKGNCPIFDDWIVVSEQPIPTENQAFSASTVPFIVHTGTVQPFKCAIKAIARSFTL
jgi:hypothetical protein